MTRWEHFWHAVAAWADRHLAHHHTTKKKHHHHKHHRLRFVTLTLRQVCGG